MLQVKYQICSSNNQAKKIFLITEAAWKRYIHVLQKFMGTFTPTSFIGLFPLKL